VFVYILLRRPRIIAFIAYFREFYDVYKETFLSFNVALRFLKNIGRLFLRLLYRDFLALSRTHWTEDWRVAWPCVYRSVQFRKAKTNIHALTGNRTHEHNVQAVKTNTSDSAAYPMMQQHTKGYIPFSSSLLSSSSPGNAKAQMVSRRPVAVEARVRTQIDPYRICGGQSGTGAGSSPSSPVSLCQYKSTVALHTHM
jgi:hypothetical protein